MEQRPVGEQLAAYNRVLKENNDIYREAVKALGLHDGAFWILYALRADGVDGAELTQKEICDILCLPKQTTNSALKKLEAAGYLELRAGKDRRRKYVRLTQVGQTLAQRTADRLIAAENRSISRLTEEERDAMIGVLRKFNSILRESTADLGKEETA